MVSLHGHDRLRTLEDATIAGKDHEIGLGDGKAAMLRNYGVGQITARTQER